MGRVLVVKIRGSIAGPGCYEYKNDINAEDFKQIALTLLDLDAQGIPIEKAIREFKNIKEKGEFPW